jgi:signal transduction histidine kinase
MESRNNVLLNTLKYDLSSSLIILDEDDNVIFINNSALDCLYRINLEARAFTKAILSTENESDCDRKEINFHNHIIGFSVKKVFENNILNRVVIIFKDITEIKSKESIENKNRHKEEIGDLAIYVAHEIKNSLNISKGFAQLMKETEEVETLKKYINIVLDENDRLNHLINNILDYTKVQKNKFDEININDFIKEILKKFYKNEKINVFFDVDTPIISSDKCKLTQIFINIIQNGIEEIDDHSGIFNIYIEKNGYIDIIFETNKEIEEHFDITKIFSLYFTTKTNGHGLGLAYSKKLVEEIHGKIKVEKNFYNGLTFTVSLPYN